MHVNMFLVKPLGAEERQEQQAKHVERGEAGGQNAKRPKRRAGALRCEQDFVLTEEAGESGSAAMRESP